MLTIYQTGARVGPGGRLRPDDPAAWRRALEQFAPGVVVIEIRTREARRSAGANAAYWTLYVQPLAEATGYEKDAIHAFLKQKFLPSQHLMIATPTGDVLEEADIVPSTRILTRTEFADYLRAIAVWADETLGITLGIGPRKGRSG